MSDIMFGGIFWVGQKCLVRKIFSRNFFGRNFFLVNIFLVETLYHQFFFIFHLGLGQNKVTYRNLLPGLSGGA